MTEEGDDRRGELAGQIVTGAASGMLSLYAGSPEAAATVGALTPIAQAALGSLAQRWLLFTEEFARRAERGDDGRDLQSHLSEHPEAAALLADAGYAAARSDDETKVEAIAQAIADGVLYEEGTSFDVGAQAVRVICQLERSHVAVLSEVSHHAGGVDEGLLKTLHPNLKDVMGALIGELVRLGVVIGGQETRSENPGEHDLTIDLYRLTSLGSIVLERYLDAAEKKQSQMGGQESQWADGLREYRGPITMFGRLGGWGHSERTAWFYDPQARVCPKCQRPLIREGKVSLGEGGGAALAEENLAYCPRGCSYATPDNPEPRLTEAL